MMRAYSYAIAACFALAGCAQNRVSALESENRLLRAEAADLRAQVADARALAALGQKEIRDLRGRCEAASVRAVSARTDLEKAERDRDEYRAMFESVRGGYHVAQEETKACKAEIDRVRAEIDPLRARLRKYGDSGEMLPTNVPCGASTRLQMGLSKRQVARILGEPNGSRMDTCGGAPGVRRWQCETLSYGCEGGGSIRVTYDREFGVTHWE